MIHYEFNNTSLYDAGRWEVPVEEITGTAETKVYITGSKKFHISPDISLDVFFSHQLSVAINKMYMHL